MHAGIERKLRTHVERIVRPIHAAEKDKLRMREELFVHMLDSYRAEHEAGKDDAVALQRCLDRLGEPATIRTELQATVSRRSRLDARVHRLLVRPQNTSLVTHGAKSAVVIGVAMTLGLMALWAAPFLLSEQKVCNGQVCELASFADIWPRWLAAGARVVQLLVPVAFNAFLIADVFRDAKPWPSVLRRLTLRGLAVVSLFAVQSATLLLVHQPEMASLLTGWWDGMTLVAFFTSIAVAVFVPMAILEACRRKRAEEWLALDITEAVAE